MASLVRTGANTVAVMLDWVTAFKSCPDFEYLRDVLNSGQAVADQRRAVRLVMLTFTDPRLLNTVTPRLTR